MGISPKSIISIALMLRLWLCIASSSAAAPQSPQSNPSPSQGGVLFEERSLDIAVATPDPAVRYRLVSGGFVSRTTDGGATWNGQLVSANVKLTAGSAPSAKVCWVVGNHGTIYLTTDGATSWKKIHAPAKVDFAAVTAKDASSTTVTSADGKKFSTANGGKNWQPIP